MNRVLCLLAAVWVFAFISCVEGQEGLIRYVRADELRDYSGRCFDAERCSLRDQGETWTIDHTCERATCYVASNGTLLEKRTRCAEPPKLDSEDCYIVRVEGKPYPECCSKLYCKGREVSFSYLEKK
ncbi:uncharacterized protein LOC135224726 [Macrobrachium nipponense]|uniref:uncharacterized protein LOC135224726 n=1 Tax=Macrobrachium nipponense TaxID=159736 RepID=UPI0030C819FA